MQSLYLLSNFLNFLFTCLPSFFCLSEVIFYKIYMVYRDVITMLIYGFTTISIITFSEAFVGEIQHCLPEAICCYITRDFIAKLIIGVSSFTITPISTCSLAFVSEIQKCLPEAVCCYITRFTLFTEILSQH